ncbi:glutamine--fructose-6-phosphate aminotransferase [isomerizing] 2 [Senna tora]|uniref:Glutamine--fructose-6-phosphate aminotransferase [isomerizing] 2 n=1 Tax=Senna tora TaxID=362788 RepID=A0A834TJA4_9FABA|nr:glutamine--fructose-6-phosphate aminotransferase [isomerizing] 2 [Senna tora]
MLLCCCSLRFGVHHTASRRLVVVHGVSATSSSSATKQSNNGIPPDLSSVQTRPPVVQVANSNVHQNTLHLLWDMFPLEDPDATSITNTDVSAIARNTHCGVHINDGAEIGVASTKVVDLDVLLSVLASKQPPVAQKIIKLSPNKLDAYQIEGFLVASNYICDYLASELYYRNAIIKFPAITIQELEAEKIKAIVEEKEQKM